MGGLTRVVIASLAALLATAQVQASIAQLSNATVVEAFIDGYAKSLMKSEQSPAGTVAIAYQGETIFARGYGYQDLEKRTPVEADKTLFRPGSVSKLFTWVAVMQQVEQGKLDLDADVNSYLDNFQIEDTWPGQPVTLRHIMTHSAGFEDGGMGYLIIDDPGRIMPLADAMARYQPYRVNPPGVQTAYSNYATALAGLIVANVSGLEFNNYIQTHIFDVLGMENASFEEPLPAQLDANMAGTYMVEGADFVVKPYEIISNFGPAGALAATSTDMVKFGLAMLNGGEYNGRRILQATTAQEMLTRQFSHDERMPGMGLGFYQTEVNGVTVLGHGGDTGSFHSELVIDKTNDLVFFVSFGAIGGAKVRSGFKPALYNQFFPVAEELPVAPADFMERASKYAGTYQFWRSGFSNFEKASKLMGGIQVAPSPDNSLIVNMGGLGVKKYVEVGKNLFKGAEPLKPGPPVIAFQENDAGDITGFVIEGAPFMSTFKVPWYQIPGFNITMLGLSVLMFLGVWLRYFYQRAAFKASAPADKSACRAALLASGANLLALIVGFLVLTAVFSKLGTEIPLAFKLWLVLPIPAFIAGLYLLFHTILVWRGGLLGGIFARIRFSLVALAAGFMCWFYWYWNILGFQYMT